MKKIAQTLSIAALIASPVAMAATQGTAGSTSTGTAQVQVTKGDGTRISDMNDFNFGVGNTAPTAKQIDDVCIFSTTGSYRLTATSQGNGSGGTQFRMVDTATNEHIRYFVEFRNDTASQNGTGLSHNVTSATFTGANTTDDTCGGTLNARLILEIDAATFNAATPSTYTDTLTIVVEPV